MRFSTFCYLYKIMNRTKEITFVTLVGSVVNAVLTVFKVVAGIAGKSTAMLADGIHSLSDLVTDLVVVVFVNIAGKGRDKDHDYGHGKFETFATFIVAAMLLAVGVKLFDTGFKGMRDILAGVPVEPPRMIAVWAAIISIVFKEVLYQYTVRMGNKLESPAMVANAWHHRSDALSSIGSLLGIGGAILLGKRFAILDPLTGCLISIFIFALAVRLMVPAVKELLDVSLPDELENKILETVMAVPGVLGFHEIKTRQEGSYIIIEGHLVVDSDISIRKAHDISKAVEKALWGEFGKETLISLHVEPEDDKD